jgi:hypothetical protein
MNFTHAELRWQAGYPGVCRDAAVRALPSVQRRLALGPANQFRSLGHSALKRAAVARTVACANDQPARGSFPRGRARVRAKTGAPFHAAANVGSRSAM